MLPPGSVPTSQVLSGRKVRAAPPPTLVPPKTLAPARVFRYLGLAAGLTGGGCSLLPFENFYKTRVLDQGLAYDVDQPVDLLTPPCNGPKSAPTEGEGSS